jgi:hypothetical protein
VEKSRGVLFYPINKALDAIGQLLNNSLDLTLKRLKSEAGEGNFSSQDKSKLCFKSSNVNYLRSVLTELLEQLSVVGFYQEIETSVNNLEETQSGKKSELGKMKKKQRQFPVAIKFGKECLN